MNEPDEAAPAVASPAAPADPASSPASPCAPAAGPVGPRIFAGSAAYAEQRGDARPVLTIGNFDGVHRGHQALLAAVVDRARARGVPAAVYTFDPPPRSVLAPDLAQPRLTDWTLRARLLGALGVEHLIIERFTRAFAQHTPEWFAAEVLGARLAPSEMVVGYDFRFGKARAGTRELLARLLPAVPVSAVEALSVDGEVVSSSALRALITEGAVERAAALLGRPHEVRGAVVPGDRRGRTLGFPTANLETDAELLPPSGVYAVEASVDCGPWRPAVANLGVRPTFGGAGRFLIEVHLLDYRGDLYGHALSARFIARLRGEQRFTDVDALAAQIGRDVSAARAALGRA
jgi:riboflavin kinase/FMN adenylyltransferase